MKRALFVLALLLAALVPAEASTFLEISRDELVEKADAVIQGRVVEVRSFWNTERTAILTEATIEVDEAIVGDASREVTLRTFGGTVGGYTIVAHGFPVFRQGERLLVFLEPERQGAHRVLGYQQGQYRLETARDGSVLAVPTVDGSRILKIDGTEAPAPRAVPLEQLKSQIRASALSAGRRFRN